MKKYLFFATALVALASCSSNDYIGEQPPVSSQSESGAIKFGTGLSAVTRADHVGADAANLLNKHFTVGGFKNSSSPAMVFDNYIVQWTENTAGKTTSNTSDWEYVGITALAPSSIAGSGNKQTIKYWDYSADQYDFVAYSTGNSTATTSEPTSGNVQVSAINRANLTTNAYTLKGARDDLQNCYVADLVTAYKSDNYYGKEVSLKFRALAAKVRVAFYETIPGYSVKDVKFYSAEPATRGTGFTTTAALIGSYNDAGTFTVKFPTIGSSNKNETDYNKAHVSFASTSTTSNQTYGTLDNAKLVTRENKEDNDAITKQYLGRTSNAATFAGTGTYYQQVLPNEDTGAPMTLIIDYTLVSTDGSKEEIHVYGAKAVVPAAYTQWKPNYAYTYIFKISDNSNGWTSIVEGDPAGLYPITFDAVVTDSEEFTQSSITTVSSPSISTYQKGHDITKDEYSAATGDIYIQVMADATLKSDLNTKGKLYTLDKAATEAEVMDALNIGPVTGATTITGRNGLVLTEAGINLTTTIVGPDGNNITVAANTAQKFTPTAPTSPATVKYYAYVYEVSDGADNEFATAVVLTGDAAPADWVASEDNVYYSDLACTTKVTTAYVAGTYYKKIQNLNKELGVKVIKVVD